MKEENETRNNVMSLRRAETIAGKYLCNRCWKPLEIVRTGQQKGYPICANKQKGLYDGGSGFVSAVTVNMMLQQDADNYRLVKESYPQWITGGLS